MLKIFAFKLVCATILHMDIEGMGEFYPFIEYLNGAFVPIVKTVKIDVGVVHESTKYI